MMSNLTPKDRRIAFALFVIISSVYFATIAGITSSNDGSHYALVRALVDKRSFEISGYLAFTENQDYALNGDLRFSDRPLGTALLAAPVYAVSAFLPPPLAPPRSKHDADNPRVIYAVLLPVISASATAVLLFWILRAHFALSLSTSALTTLAFAFGTMTWKYGSLLYSHATSGLAVMGAIVLLLRQKPGFWLGMILGASVLMEYTNVVFVALIGLVYVWQVSNLSHKWQRIGWLILGGLLPAAFLIWYNTVNFGGPLELSTFNVDTSRWPQNTSFFHDFATPIWVGLPAMLFYGSDNQGLFWLAPISLLGLVGLRGLWKHSTREFTLSVGIFVIMLCFFSTSTTFNPYTNDGRYLTPFLGLWFVAVGFGVEWVVGVNLRVDPTGGARIGGARIGGAHIGAPLRWAILYGLLFLSLRNQFMHIALSWGHDLNLATLRAWAAAPENILTAWSAVLPNALNVPLWWGLMAVGWLAWRLRQGRGRAAELESLRH